MSKRLITTLVSGLIFATLLILVGINVGIAQDRADTGAFSRDLDGWAWSATSGWISFSDKETSGTYQSEIGVDGHLRGYAWSGTLGWIDLDPSGTPPGNPGYTARVDIDGHLDGCNRKNAVCGWARAVEGSTYPTSGWDGWIRLGYDGHNPRRDDVCIEDNNVIGWMWGDTNMGWAGMWNTTTYFESHPPIVEEPFRGHDHQIKVTQEPEWYCNQANPPVRFEWSYKRDHSDYIDVNQGRYDIQIAEDVGDFQGNDCNDCLVDESYTGFFSSPDSEGRVDNSFEVGDELDFRSWYWVRVRVWDEYGVRSYWSKPKQFETRIRHPYVDISQDRPPRPYAEERVYFNDETNYYDWACECDITEDYEYYEETQHNCQWWEVWDGNQCLECSECDDFIDIMENEKGGTRNNEIAWRWDFEGGDPSSIGPGTDEETYRHGSAEFDSDGDWEVELTVSADIEALESEKARTGDPWIQDVQCTIEDPFIVNVRPLLPDWQEIY